MRSDEEGKDEGENGIKAIFRREGMVRIHSRHCYGKQGFRSIAEWYGVKESGISWIARRLSLERA